MNYIDLFRTRINKEVKKNNGDIKFVNLLFERIKEEILKAGGYCGLPDVDLTTLKDYFETAKNEYLSVNPIDPGISHSLTKEGFVTWLDEEREKTLNDDYIDRYLKYLKKMGRSDKVVAEIEKSSLSILKKMADPQSSTAVYKKGLVVGAVQSGKTGNFNAVINRAIDSGYVLIIVLSGIMEDLRSQTQKRIESDVIGEGRVDCSQSSGRKGVGEIRGFGQRGDQNVIQVKTITSEDKDFNNSTKELDFTLNDKYVFVCKKNVSVLRNLIVWLHDSLDKGKDKHNIPLLIIDDEADNASLNNAGAKGREYASKTNGHIRSLLGLFHVKTYLGYTATPFANVLQDRNDSPKTDWVVNYKLKGETQEKKLKRVDNIFPDDFIELLDPPSNYVGAQQIFETVKTIENSTEDNDKLPLVEPVEDYIKEFPSRVFEDEGLIKGIETFANKDEWDSKVGEGGIADFNTYKDYKDGTRASKKEDDFPKELPESLKDAIKCFILSLAIRESRKIKIEKSKLYNPHNTMLIHISRFTFWQNTTKALVDRYLSCLISGINNDKLSGENSIYIELERTWNRYYANIVENVKLYLPKAYEDEFLVPIVYDSLKTYLPESVKGIEVKAINTITKEKLEYPNSAPKKIIAIGGNKLSRGFTLEGLTINYFIRTTNYSDTLLQMGRWFGYRPGYLDCCKIFTTKDSLDKFNSTTKCIEELEGEFVKMEEKGKAPSNFVLRVRKHPGTLKITRPSILKNAIDVKWSYQDQLEMTTKFNIGKEHIDDVWSNFKDNIAPRFNSYNKGHGLLTFETNGAEVINILKIQSNNFDQTRKLAMSKFIKLCNTKHLLDNWTVALKVTGASPNSLLPCEIGIDSTIIDTIKLAKRSGPIRIDDRLSFINDKIFKASGKSANILAANTDMAITLTESEKKDAIDLFYINKAKELKRKDSSLTNEVAIEKAKKSKTIPERYFREKFSEDKGLLIIYLLDSQYVFNQQGVDVKLQDIIDKFKCLIDKEDIDLKIPLVGYAIGFPPIDNDPGGEYMQGDYNIKEDEPEEEDQDATIAVNYEEI